MDSDEPLWYAAHILLYLEYRLRDSLAPILKGDADTNFHPANLTSF